MKYVPIVAAIGLGIILLAQKGTTAGPNPPPRTVPVIVQDVMPPSRMVSAVIEHNATTTAMQIPIPLQPGQVFVLTSWTAAADGGQQGKIVLHEGPTQGPFLETRRDVIWLTAQMQSVSRVFPTGIRFPQDAGGMANIYATNFAPPVVAILVRGYITDDF